METGRKDGIVSLSKYSDTIKIPMKLQKLNQLSEQRYVFYDKRQEIVGEIEAPFLAMDVR